MTVKCASCKQEIEGRVITALEKSWHPEHFICKECKKPIDSSFSIVDKEPVCDDCHTKLYARTCKACNEPIKDHVITALDGFWHKEHFVCLDCKNPITAEKFKDIDGKPCCIDCFAKNHAANCKGCNLAIVGDSTVALDGKWHPSCFKCSNCDKVITEKTFAVANGKPLCAKC